MKKPSEKKRKKELSELFLKISKAIASPTSNLIEGGSITVEFVKDTLTLSDREGESVVDLPPSKLTIKIVNLEFEFESKYWGGDL
jgi:hypothetical protein